MTAPTLPPGEGPRTPPEGEGPPILPQGEGRPILPEGESLIATFTPDRLTYWRAHLILAVALGTVVGLILLWQGNPYPVMGPLGAALAIAVRASYVASESLSDLWHLTTLRLIGPRGLSVPRAQITAARPFLGSVQIVTRTGDKHLIKYLANPKADAARLHAPDPQRGRA